MGINVQVCWEKFANYWDVEMRLVPMERDRFHLCGGSGQALDETRSGSSRSSARPSTGRTSPSRRSAALDAFQSETGIDIPVHVDGASGAFVAPFSTPISSGTFDSHASLDQRVRPQVRARLPGVGWVVWRDAEALPEDLIFWVNYLGDNMPTFALNFSARCSGRHPVLQPPTSRFRRLSRCRSSARGRHACPRRSASSAVRADHEGRRAAVFRSSCATMSTTSSSTSRACYARGWRWGPSGNREDSPARVVVRRGFTHDLADLLVADLERQLPRLQNQPAPIHDSTSAEAFHH